MKFVLIARDGTDADAINRRLQHRDAHLQIGKDQSETGERLMGGPILNDQDQMCGSVLVCDFPDRAALDAWLETEPYVTGNVWGDIEILRCEAKFKEDR